MNQLDENVSLSCSRYEAPEDFEDWWACHEAQRPQQTERSVYALTWWLVPLSLNGATITAGAIAVTKRSVVWFIDGLKQ